MGGTTPNYSLPYPTGTDRVADGDNAMQALAEKLDAFLVGALPDNHFTAGATPITSYPPGLSIMGVGGAGSDWFSGLPCTVYTFRLGGRGWQVIMPDAADGIHMRGAITTGGWGYWTPNLMAVTASTRPVPGQQPAPDEEGTSDD